MNTFQTKQYVELLFVNFDMYYLCLLTHVWSKFYLVFLHRFNQIPNRNNAEP